MALETGTYINSLNASNPAATDGIAQADDHMRLIKSTIKASFPGVTGAVTSTHTELNHCDGVSSNIQTQLDAAGSTIDIGEVTSIGEYQLVMMSNQSNNVSAGDGSARSLGVESEYNKLTYNPAASSGTLTVGNVTCSEWVTSGNGLLHNGDTDTQVSFSNSGNEIKLITGNSTKLTANSNGIAVTGALSKSSGSFKIDHPLPAKADTHHLVHSFVEGPQADNIYRGQVALVDGAATVNIDTASGMSDGTFVALNGDVQCFTSNETDFCAVKGSVSGNVLSIAAQDDTCTATVSWMVVGERHDPHMIATEWTDDNGKVIVEPAKE